MFNFIETIASYGFHKNGKQGKMFSATGSQC